MMTARKAAKLLCAAALFTAASHSQTAPENKFTAASGKFTVLHAARLLDVAAGKVITPGEVLVEGNRIREAGQHVTRPAGAQVIELGDTTLMPGLIDAHVHLFLHPRQQKICRPSQESTFRSVCSKAAAAARADLHGRLHRRARHGFRRRRLRRHRRSATPSTSRRHPRPTHARQLQRDRHHSAATKTPSAYNPEQKRALERRLSPTAAD